MYDVRVTQEQISSMWKRVNSKGDYWPTEKRLMIAKTKTM